MTRLSDAEVEEIVECLQYAEDGRAADVIRQLQADLAAMTAERDALRAMMSDEGCEFPGMADVAGKPVDVTLAVTASNKTFDPDYAKKVKP